MTDDRKSLKNYEVGWGKPPHHTRFKKGQSGNPKGRPPQTRNLKTDLLAELGERIRVREGDREIMISKQGAFVKSLVARALKGDARASSLLVNLMAKLLDVQPEASERDVSESERAIIDAYWGRRFAEAASPTKLPQAKEPGSADPGLEGS